MGRKPSFKLAHNLLGRMEDLKSKSRAISNTHHFVSVGDYRINETMDMINRLAVTYGPKKPLKIATCCNVILTYQGKNQKHYDHSHCYNLSEIINFKDKMDQDVFVELMERANLGFGGSICLPGFNLVHTTYQSLLPLEGRDLIPLLKQSKPKRDRKLKAGLTKRPPESKGVQSKMQDQKKAVASGDEELQGDLS